MLIGQRLAGQLQSAGRKIVVIVDDAQWADELSMEAMQYAARRLRSEPIMLVLAFRGNTCIFRKRDRGPGPSKAWRQLLESDRGTRLALDGLQPEELLLLAVANGQPGLQP